ncbi:unnamed protein product, partial [Darwinula stevensoni]
MGQLFVNQHYAMFDDPDQRQSLASRYTEESKMICEGALVIGSTNIMEKLKTLASQTFQHFPTAINCLAIPDDQIMIQVVGKLEIHEKTAHTFAHTFILKFINTDFVIQYEIFARNQKPWGSRGDLSCPLSHTGYAHVGDVTENPLFY